MRVLLTVEELELRLVPSAPVCDANPTYASECDYLNALIGPSSITDTAVQSGNWSDPATWSNGVPDAGATVWIPNGATVTVDGQQTTPLRAIRDNGVLTFAPNVNTSLLVNTLIVGTDDNPTGQPEGELDIGTSAAPIEAGVTAELLFADLGPQAALFPDDSQQLTGGLICMGTINIFGSTVTPYVNMQNTAIGATTLTLSSQPTGWQAGDVLLIPGTSASRTQTEQIAIAAIQDNADGTASVTLAAPLRYAHAAPAGQSVQVADENRNVTIADQGTATQYADGAYGHVMIMHNDAAAIAYAAFLDPGRTDKSVVEGSLLSNGTVNVAGRYSLHFHECYWPSINGEDPPIQVVGCYQAGGVGWGYVNHRSNVDFLNDVAFNDYGAAFADQAGDELGSFQNCLAVLTKSDGYISGGPGGEEFRRVKAGDFGFMGQGFWLASPGTSLIGNSVWDAYLSYDYLTLDLAGQGLPGLVRYWNGQLTQLVPLAPFKNNTAGETACALQMGWHTPGPFVWTVFDHFTAFGVTLVGMNIDNQGYVGNMDFEDPIFLAAPGHRPLCGIRMALGYSQSLIVNNGDVEGFQKGIALNSYYETQVEGGYWDNATNFYIPESVNPREIDFTGNIVFGPHSKIDYQWQTTPLLLARILARPEGNLAYLSGLFAQDRVLLPNGQELFAPWQAPDYVPIPLGSANAPAFLAGLTESQMLAMYGMCLGGATAPSDTELIGPPSPQRSQYVLPGPLRHRAGTKFVPRIETITVQQPIGGQPPYYDVAPSTVQLGWNLVTAVINKTPHSWLFWGV